MKTELFKYNYFIYFNEICVCIYKNKLQEIIKYINIARFNFWIGAATFVDLFPSFCEFHFISSLLIFRFERSEFQVLLFEEVSRNVHEIRETNPQRT